MTEPVLTYRSVSTASQGPDQVNLALSTEATTAGLFFDGFLTHPEQAAAALLLIAKVARTRF